MIYTCFKFYLKDKRRIAAFAEKIDDKLFITVIPCSRKDQFIKRKARELYEVSNKDNRVCIDIVDDKPMKTFISFLYENYYKRKQITSFVLKNILVK